MMKPDKRIEWCRENIAGFRDMHDQAEKARMETEANRARYSAYMSKPAHLTKSLEKKQGQAA